MRSPSTLVRWDRTPYKPFQTIKLKHRRKRGKGVKHDVTTWMGVLVLIFEKQLPNWNSHNLRWWGRPALLFSETEALTNPFKQSNSNTEECAERGSHTTSPTEWGFWSWFLKSTCQTETVITYVDEVAQHSCSVRQNPLRTLSNNKTQTQKNARKGGQTRRHQQNGGFGLDFWKAPAKLKQS
jgi:hypothetical protein